MGMSPAFIFNEMRLLYLLIKSEHLQCRFHTKLKKGTIMPYAGNKGQIRLRIRAV